MRIIDFSDKQDAHIQNAQAIRRIIESIGRAEAMRQNRQRTTNVLHAMAAGGTQEQIAQAALSEPGFDTGFQGFIQRLGAQFAPNVVSPIEQQIARQGLTRAFEDPLIRKQREATLAATEERTNYYKKGGRANRGGSALQKQWEFKRKQRDLLVERKEDALDQAEIDSIARQIKEIDIEMKAISEQLQPPAEVAEFSPSDVSGFFQGVGADLGNFKRTDKPQDIRGSFGSIGAGSGLVSPTTTPTRKKRKPNETIEQYLKRVL